VMILKLRMRTCSCGGVETLGGPRLSANIPPHHFCGHENDNLERASFKLVISSVPRSLFSWSWSIWRYGSETMNSWPTRLVLYLPSLPSVCGSGDFVLILNSVLSDKEWSIAIEM
jgi:hypothetical protein